MRGRRALLQAAGLAAMILAAPLLSAAPLQGQATHLVTVVGLGGDPAYTEDFMGWALQIREAALDRFLLPEERVVLLAPDTGLDPAVDGRSDREGVEAALNALAERAGANDPVLVILIGHGSFRNDEARFNLPGPDLTAEEWAVLLDGLGDRPLALVNTASASGPFVPALAAPDRTIIAATKTGAERNETQFGRFFAEALGGEAADLDKDGMLSLLEAFTYARAEVARWYQEENLLLTEHAVLEDDGDGEGSEEPSRDGSDGSTDGAAAALFRLAAPTQTAMPAEVLGDSVTVRLMNERAALEARVAQLRALRGQMDPEEYDRELEELLLELALKTREINARTGGGGGS